MPHGAKGVGELPMDVGAPAVVAAIHDATGVWMHDLPRPRSGSWPRWHRGRGRVSTRFMVNGEPVELETPGMRRLLDVLREDLGLTGTKEGCGEGECGACSVLLDGRVVDSCLVPMCQVDGADVHDGRGLAGPTGRLPAAPAGLPRARRRPVRHLHPGMLMAAQALPRAGGGPDDAGIREAIAGNLCRCTGYTKIVSRSPRSLAPTPPPPPRLTMPLEPPVESRRAFPMPTPSSRVAEDRRSRVAPT